MSRSLIALSCAALLFACGDKSGPRVVVYCALDDVFAEPIFSDFEKATGVHVQPHFDNELTKTVALAKQIVLEKSAPKADVFWNNEIVNTIRIQQAGALERYVSGNAADIPAQWKDPEGYWTGFAARARILIVNTEKCPPERRPTSYLDFIDPKRNGEWAIAKPIAGTTATHLAVLFELLGTPTAQDYWLKLEKNGGAIVAGNGPVMREVRDGRSAFGFTDTDDYWSAKSEGRPVEAIYPDQGKEALGCLVIPNTISLVRGGPNADAAKKFIDFVLSRDVERRLAFGPSAQIPVRADVEAPPHVKRLSEFKVMTVDFNRAAEQFAPAQEWLTRPRPR